MSQYRVPRGHTERRALLHRFKGQVVTLVLRHREVRGRVITVAVANWGTSSDFVVINVDGPNYYPQVYSLAAIRLVRVVES